MESELIILHAKINLEEKMKSLLTTKTLFISFILILLFMPLQHLSAHCDGLDGPVVKAARKALETKNVNHVLIWVKAEDEQTVRDAFTKTLKVRNINNKVKEFADMYFFETVVRIHRQREGEQYTGLKPAGRDLGPVVPAADKSIEIESFTPVHEVFSRKKLGDAEIESLFKNVIETKNFDPNDIEAGRKFVDAYVTYIHLAEEAFENPDRKHSH